MPEIPTLRDVAAAAGVSKSTAQRAMANDHRCSAKTREAVQRIAEQLNYVPDPIFAAVGSRRRLRRIHGTPLAYLVELSEGRQAAGIPYYPLCQARAAQLGYRLEMIDLASLDVPKRMWQMLYARGIAGVLVGSIRSKFHGLLCENRQFPAMCVGRIDPLPFHTSRPAIQLGVRRAWEEMIRRGYRRIGAAIFRHDPPLEDDFSRFSAILGLQVLDLPDEFHVPPLVCGFDHTEDEFLRWVEEFKPDAVLAFHDGLLPVLEGAGYQVPRDIGFACLHIKLGQSNARISGVCENEAMVAASAVNFLDQMIRHGERGVHEAPINLMIEGAWIQGKTLRPVSRRASKVAE